MTSKKLENRVILCEWAMYDKLGVRDSMVGPPHFTLHIDIKDYFRYIENHWNAMRPLMHGHPKSEYAKESQPISVIVDEETYDRVLNNHRNDGQGIIIEHLEYSGLRFKWESATL